MKRTGPIRALHCFASLGKGGIETWLINILRLRCDELQFDFLLNTLGGDYDAEARSYGCRIHHAPPIRQLGEYLRFLEQTLRTNQYDVLHLHGEEFMGDAMKVAAKLGVPVRIAHCHNTQLARGKIGVEMRIRSLRHRTVDRARILRYATDILACSNEAGTFLMGSHWGSDTRCKPLFCGITLDQFDHALNKWNRESFRSAHGIPKDAIVVGHAGSMGPSPQKNHPFILEIFAELARQDRRVYLYLAGEGPHRGKLENMINELGLASRVLMPGLCHDVPSLMMHGFDVHLLPSLFEGLPIVGLEAVASGLYTVCSATITKDFTEYFSHRVKPLPLDASVSIWAEQVQQAVDKRMSAQEGISLIERSAFSIGMSTSNLLGVYQTRLQFPHNDTRGPDRIYA